SVVATMRWEYVDRLRAEAPRLGGFQRPEVLSPLEAAMLRDVVTEPLRLAGIEAEDGLVSRMVNDTGTGAALPLLSYTLHLLTEPLRKAGGALTHEAYDLIGGVRGAVERQADAALAE